MKVMMYMAVSRDGFISGNYDDTSWVSPQEQQQYVRMINGVGNMIIGRRTYEVMRANHEFDQLQNPFVVIMTNYTYKNEEHRHFTHAKPKNIIAYLRALLDYQTEEILSTSLTILKEESANSYPYKE